jgi:tetratricopeptide (TPR) repeat protein
MKMTLASAQAGEGRRRSKKLMVIGLLLGALDAKQLRAAIRAHALKSRPSILHRDFLSVGHFFLCFALYTISFSHGFLLNFWAIRPKCVGILVAATNTVKRQNRPAVAIVFSGRPCYVLGPRTHSEDRDLQAMRKLLCAVTILATSCGQVAPLSDSDLDRLPDYQRARKAVDSGDFRAAAGLYNRVIQAAPEVARSHLELGLLYDEKIGDPIAAIYHYRQYLALRPDSDKKLLVADFIERAQLALAAKLPPATGVDTSELTRLQTENAVLRGRVAELEKAAAIEPVANPPPAAEPVAESVKSRTHVVQKGDTLQSLALRYYGARSNWEKIYAANRTILPSKDQLKVGQQLVIP